MLRRNLGVKGEHFAEKFLKSRGYQIITRNFHSKFGEIDLVGLDNKTLVFIEVKTRWSNKFGLPEEAVTPWKLKAICRTGEYFKMLHPELPETLRIDLVAIQLSPGGEVEEVRLIENISG